MVLKHVLDCCPQVWCEGLADLIWNMRQQVRTLECLRSKIENKQQQQTSEMDPTAQHIQSLVSGITELLSNLVTGTFVIEKQPPQVINLAKQAFFSGGSGKL